MRKPFNIVFVICTLLFLSCSKQEEPSKKRLLHIPENLEIYHASTKQKNAQYNIYVSLDANCGSCIDKLKKVSEFSSNLKKEYEITFILSAFNKGYIDFAVEEAFGEKKFSIFYDKKEMFYKLNNQLSSYYFFITDNSHNILKYGNPDDVNEMESMIKSLKL